MKLSEYLLLIGLTIFGLILIIDGLSLDYNADKTFGPGFLPINTAILLIFICVCRVFIRLYQTRIKAGRVCTIKDTEFDSSTKNNIKGLLVTIFIILCGIALMTLGTILLPIFLIILFISWIVSRHPLWLSFVVSIITTSVIYLIFSVWLGLPVQ